MTNPIQTKLLKIKESGDLFSYCSGGYLSENVPSDIIHDEAAVRAWIDEQKSQDYEEFSTDELLSLIHNAEKSLESFMSHTMSEVLKELFTLEDTTQIQKGLDADIFCDYSERDTETEPERDTRDSFLYNVQKVTCLIESLHK